MPAASSSCSAQQGSKEVSSLRLSCDSCRFRKTKCDRKSRLESGNVGCTFCHSMGLSCSITPGTTSRRHMPRLGKRMKALLNDSQDANEEERANLIRAATPSLPSSSSRATSQDKSKEADSRVMHAVTHFLGVQGLTRVNLDACIEAFFRRLGSCMPLSQSYEIFWPRYQAFLDIACGASTSLPKDCEPASELLVLAVACRGCGNTALSDKDVLMEAISDRFAQLANTAESDTLLSLDGIEAVNLISERVIRPVHFTTSSPLQMDVLGRSSSVKLALMSYLNVPPPDTGLPNAQRDRSGFIFWTIFAHDAFRSVAARKMYLIHEEDIGWTPPDQLERPGNYPYYGKSMYKLSLVARHISRELLSVRAKRQGLSRSTLIDTVARLNAWHEDVEGPLKFKWTHPDLYEQDQDGIDLRAKRSFMLTIWLSLYLQVWASLPARTSTEMSDQDNHLESEILQAYFRMASLAKYCQRHELADCAPNELRNVPAAWALWYACYIRRAAGLYINIAAHKIDQLNQACHALVDCVRSAQSLPDSEELASRLVETIAQALALAEQRLLKGNYSSSGNGNKMQSEGSVDLDTHSDFILRAADEGMPAFKSSLTFKPAAAAASNASLESSGNGQASFDFQMPLIEGQYDYQSDLSVGGNRSRPLAFDEMSPLQLFDGNFLDIDMQDFLASCGIEPSLYNLD